MTAFDLISEADWTSTVIQIAHDFGWLAHHDRPARRKDGSWSTAVQGDVGFPDLVLVRESDGGLIYAELKTERGQLDDNQKPWIAALEASHNAVYVWRPSNRKVVEALLR